MLVKCSRLATLFFLFALDSDFLSKFAERRPGTGHETRVTIPGSALWKLCDFEPVPGHFDEQLR
jgi:hypothetical protein